MPVEIRALNAFYETPVGQAARRLISFRLRARWSDLRAKRLLGFGYATPYLRPYLKESERVVAATAAAMGALEWAPNGRGLVVLSDEQALPFADASFDRLLLVHGLEMTEAQRPFMRELWRVLAADGRLMIVAPNRASLWSQLESSPFGHGQPYSRGQLLRLLEQALFQIEYWDSALFTPPFGLRRRGGAGWDRVGRRLWPRLAGVHIVEASKSLYAPALAAPAAARRRLVPKLADIGA